MGGIFSRPAPVRGDGKVVLITGCSEGGIGYALAEQFAKRGCTVYATARTVSKMAGLQEQGIKTLQLDVNDAARIEEVMSEVVKESGQIDILINNAGMAAPGPVADISVDKVKQVFETNFFSVMRLSQAAFPHMAARRTGLIVNVASGLTYVNVPFMVAYTASKRAIAGLCDAMRMEMKPFGIHVMMAVPSLVATKIWSTGTQDLNISEGGLYEPFRSAVKDAASHLEGSGAAYMTPPDVYGGRVADVCLRPNPPWRMMYGSAGWFALHLPNYTPMWLQDFLACLSISKVKV